jgi:hypothetical protein
VSPSRSTDAAAATRNVTKTAPLTAGLREPLAPAAAGSSGGTIPASAQTSVTYRREQAGLAEAASLEPVPDIARTLFLLRPGELLVAGENPDAVLDVIRACGVQRVVLLSSQGARTRPAAISHCRLPGHSGKPLSSLARTGPSCGREALIPKHWRRRTWFARSRREPRRPGTSGCRRSTIPCAADDWLAKPGTTPVTAPRHAFSLTFSITQRDAVCGRKPDVGRRLGTA